MKRRDILLLLLSLVLAVVGAVQLISAFTSRRAAEEANGELRKIYRAGNADGTGIPTLPPAAPTAAPAETEEPADTPTPAPTVTPSVTEAAEEAKVTRLKRSMYPDNPGLKVSDAFRELRRENGDIVGWLTVGKWIDEAVTQRDNEFYMDHDIAGRENVSGAVFLDQLISLTTRPYTLILYGHNMRDESRFGWLRKYERPDFYEQNRIIEFNTLYEEGKYIVFAEGIVSMEEGEPGYLDILGLASLRTDEREQAIDVLRSASVLENEVDVRVDDQILLLVTCVDKETERRVVAARRIREGEEF